MKRPSLVVPALASALLLVLSGTSLQAQVTPDQAAAFIGDWAATFEGGPQGSISMDISIADEGGTLSGTVSGSQGAPNEVEEFSMSGEDLVLAYTVDFGGQSAPIELTLSPDAEMLDVTLSLGGGGGPMGPITGTAERQ